MSGPSPFAIVSALEAAGITHAFGLPGTQNLGLFEALRRSTIRTVVPSHELGAAFMAGGYFRASGNVALLLTIPGPGLTYAVTGLAEAALDSAALVHLTAAPAREPGRAFQLQSLDQEAMISPVVKAVVTIGAGDDAEAAVRRSVNLALFGEPGPVTLQTDGAVSTHDEAAAGGPRNPGSAVEEIAAGIEAAVRVILLVGQGAAGAASAVTVLAERIGAAVVTTTSGRGVVPEDHRLSLGYELAGTEAGPLNELIATGDLVLALGCKLSHNGSRGFGMKVPAEKLVHVDASPVVIGANYPARIGLVARCEDVLPRLVDRVAEAPGWSDAELDRWRKRGLADGWPGEPEPLFSGRVTAAGLIGALREALPRDAIVVTDSGRHQMLVRRWFRVLSPRGLIAPTNLQSMGFAIPAAIGAALAAPDRRVVAVIGDGGLMMSGFEMRTAIKEGIDLAVIVFNDGGYGLIRRAQLSAYGRAPGSDFEAPDLSALAGALGVGYARIGDDPAAELAEALALPGVTLIEAPMREAAAMRTVRAKGTVKRWLRRG